MPLTNELSNFELFEGNDESTTEKKRRATLKKTQQFDANKSDEKWPTGTEDREKYSRERDASDARHNLFARRRRQDPVSRELYYLSCTRCIQKVSFPIF
jgi:hypothetical protein